MKKILITFLFFIFFTPITVYSEVVHVSLDEAVSLAAIPKGPTIYSPLKNPENNKERRLLILNEMKDDGRITTEEYDKALITKLSFVGINPNKEESLAPYFQDYVLNELKNIPGLENYAYSGLKVQTTLDLSLNNEICDAITQRIENELEKAVEDPKYAQKVQGKIEEADLVYLSLKESLSFAAAAASSL